MRKSAAGPQAPAAQCFWMENGTGRHEWVLAASVYGRPPTRRECFELDRCDGGRGRSGGGCYKRADAPTAPRHPW